MLRTYLTPALRQLGRNRLYSALNIGGLAVGLAVSTYIGFYSLARISLRPVSSLRQPYLPGHIDVELWKG